MARGIRSSEQVTSWSDLLRLHECGSERELSRFIEERLDEDLDVGQVELEESAEGTEVWVTVGACNVAQGDGVTLQFPFTLDAFWSAVDDLEDLALKRQDAYLLPHDPDDFDPAEMLEALARFLDVEPDALRAAIGDSWTPVEGDEFVGNNEWTDKWYSSGDPADVLIGIGGEYASVADVVPTSSDDDGTEFEQGSTVDIELRTATTLGEIKSSLDEARRNSRAHRGNA